jgi:tRNA(Leu) C34 or U34 (ribose-2'-O)-methylase TrmL
MRIALFEPDIPQNTGTVLRLAACLGLEAHLIEPAGFPVSDRAFRRAGMDYLDRVSLTRHPSWPDFERWRAAHGLQLVLFTTKAAARRISNTAMSHAISCCSAANRRASPIMCTQQPMCVCVSRCAPGCAHSTSR